MESKLTISENGDKCWMLPKGTLHREDGPAVEHTNGFKAWYINGLRHREDGPAIKYDSNIYQAWFLDDIEYTEIRYKEKMRFNKLKKLL
jgi:hypothetical protein